jgi:hypothetical protein
MAELEEYRGFVVRRSESSESRGEIKTSRATQPSIYHSESSGEKERLFLIF